MANVNDKIKALLDRVWNGKPEYRDNRSDYAGSPREQNLRSVQESLGPTSGVKIGGGMNKPVQKPVPGAVADMPRNPQGGYGAQSAVTPTIPRGVREAPSEGGGNAADELQRAMTLGYDYGGRSMDTYQVQNFANSMRGAPPEQILQAMQKELSRRR